MAGASEYPTLSLLERVRAGGTYVATRVGLVIGVAAATFVLLYG